MSKRNHLWIWGAVCGLSLSLGGCDALGGLFGGDEGGGGSGSAEEPVSDESKQAMSAYAQGFNALIDDPTDMIDEYTGEIPKEGPQEGESYSLFPKHNMAKSDIKDAKEHFGNAKGMAPDSLSKLEPLADDALAKMETIHSLFEDAHKYYDAEDYKDDDFAKGREIHDKMVSAIEGFHEASGKLEKEMSAIEEQQALEELKRFEDEKGYSYWFRNVNLRAKQLVEARDKDTFEERYPKLDKAYQGLQDFKEAQGSEINEAFSSYVGQADRFHSAAKKLKRQYDEDPESEEIGRLRGDMVNAYNSCVQVGNSLYELEASGAL